jgi:hypothetical protein
MPVTIASGRMLCGIGEPPVPCVGADVECVVCYVDTGDLVRDDREQRRIDRRALATGRRQSAKIFCVLPMETKGDEPATDAIFVGREVFVTRSIRTAKSVNWTANP